MTYTITPIIANSAYVAIQLSRIRSEMIDT